MTILYVEDEKDIRDEVIEILQNDVLKLYLATDGESGLELYKKYSPDIVITDIRMALMNGLEMSKEILKFNADVPIIVFSAFNETSYLMEAIKLDIHSYVTKPVDLKDLFAALDKASQKVIQKKDRILNEKLLEQYKIAVDKNEIVSKTNRRGIITYVNDSFCEISGYSRDELIGSSHNIIRHPDTTKEFFQDMWKTIALKKEWKGKIKNRAKDGSFYIVDSTIIPVLNSRNKVEEYISIRKDITQEEINKRSLETNLEESSSTVQEKKNFINEYDSALHNHALFCRTNKDCIVTSISQSFLDLLGLRRKDIIGQHYKNIVTDVDFAKVNTVVYDSIHSLTAWVGSVRHKDTNNTTLHLNTSFIPIQGMDGNLHEMLCLYIDLTSQINLNHSIIETQQEVIAKMGAIGETRSKETGLHVKRVAEYSKLLALKYGLSAEEAEEIKMASPMHDIGKVAIPDSILNKPGKLTEDEFEMMKTHAQIGFDMLSGSSQSLLKTAAIISKEHHEQWDGQGYPSGKKGKDIHIYGRITAIADVFDALGHDRIYKKAWPLKDILNFFKAESGKHFDPELVDIFMRNLDDFLLIKKRFENNMGTLNVA